MEQVILYIGIFTGGVVVLFLASVVICNLKNSKWRDEYEIETYEKNSLFEIPDTRAVDRLKKINGKKKGL